MATRFGKWVLTRSGRRLAGTLVLTGAAGSFLGYYLPNTVFLSGYKEVTCLYKSGIEVPVSGQVTSLLDEVMNDLGLSQLEKEISVYTAYGFDIFHAGSTMVTSGGILGVPINFKYSSVEEFDPTNVTVNNKPVAWSTAAGESLKQSFVLSKEAKKFVLAREITNLGTAEPFVYGTLSAGAISMVYTMASSVNTKLDFYAKPRTVRMFFYGVLSIFGYAFWMLLKDMATVNYEANADRTVADLGEKYAIGGLEFYEKILQRNMALYKLMGSEGEKLYTAYGNDQVLLRTKHMPFTLRRDYMKNRVEEYKKEKGEAPSADKDIQTQKFSLDIDSQTQNTLDINPQTQISPNLDTQTLNTPDSDVPTQSSQDVVDVQTQNTSNADKQTQNCTDAGGTQTQNTLGVDTITETSPDVVTQTQTCSCEDTSTQNCAPTVVPVEENVQN